MKWYKSELLNSKESNIELHQELVFEKNEYSWFERLRELRDTQLDLNLNFDKKLQLITIDYHIQGTMILPCAITLDDVEKEFDLDGQELLSFTDDMGEDVIKLDDELDLKPLLLDIILSVVPIKVVKEGIEYPKGTDWEVLTEKELQKQKENQVDPRLAKLKEFKFEE